MIYFFQGLTILNRGDQCTSFKPLVDYFGPGPPTHGQPGLSGMVVGGPKWYENHGPSDSKINACQGLAKKTMTTKLLSLIKWTRR